MRQIYRIFRTITFLLAVLMLVAGCRTTPSRPLVTPDAEPVIMPDTQYTNASFAALIEKYAPDGRQVDYAAWSESPEDLAALERHVRLLAAISPDNHPEQFPSRAAVLSYWVNAYNALVMHTALQYWPLETVMEVKASFSSFIIPGKGFFYDHEVVVGGEKTNLYDLEKKIFRTQKDPRLHFALNCASSSCPVLRPWEWTDEQLTQATAAFINTPENVAVRDNTLYLSLIFKWYKKDFGEDIHQYLQQYANDELVRQIQTARKQNYPIKYVEYNWDLNASSDESAAGDRTSTGDH